ncbi:MAG: LPXTG cell wall anchor domain-containing protein [Oscillospiraceae bacterium]|nr:LPXTG cell wall anchor domain-containing protein [Oscillospiraceae bacterium]
MKKRVFALLLCTLMCMSLLPVSAFADGESVMFTVTYMNQGVEYTNKSYAKGSTIPAQDIAPKPESGGVCFRGWLKDGEAFDFANTAIEENITLTASWGDAHSPKQETGCVVEGDEATCTEKGYTTYACAYCNELIRIQDIEPLGHDIHEVPLKDATCTEDGNELYYKCSRCNTLYSDLAGTSVIEDPASVVLQKRGHHLVDVQEQEPTCGTAGHEAYQRCDRDGCTYTTEIVTLSATGNHQWSEWTVTKAATCLEKGSKTRSCANCDASETQDIDPLHPEGHTWDDATGVCTTCGAKGFRLTVTIQGSGTASVGETSLSSDQTKTFDPAENMTLTLTPGENQTLSSVSVNGNAATLSDNTLTLSAPEGGSAVVLAAFVSHTTGAAASASIGQNTDTAAATAAISKQAELANKYKVIASEVPFVLYDVKPVWSDSTGNEMTAEEVKAAGGVTFTLQPPPNTSAENYNYEVFHFNGTDFEPVSSSLTVTADTFSTFGVFAVPKTAAAAATGSSGSSETTTSTTVVVEKTTPEPPTISYAPIIDGGTTQTGAILKVDSTMEYMRKDSSEGYKAIAGTKLDDLAAGTYYVRYKETATTNASPATTVKIEEYYTVTAKLLYGKGTYEVTSDNNKYDDDVYLVKKGEDITFKFTPENHYWLYVININDEYVGQSNVKTSFTLKDVQKKILLSYGFSDSSSSPKTGDESNVALYAVVAVAAAAGIAGICVYLFRKKKK